MIDLRLGDCLDVLKTLPDESVDAVVTDPPYGLSFMGKRWDYDVPAVEVWAECLRVLKPGGHLLAFAGTRTQHRMAVRIEDAGFEIRDMIAWVYGTGFPKSLDVSKAIDKAAPAADEGKRWQGWGTALKPALEPITVARKPFKGTIAANVLEHGTAGLNIDGCRVPMDEDDFAKLSAGVEKIRAKGGTMANSWKNSSDLSGANPANPQGRWPANLIHDGSEDVADTLGDASRFFYCAKASKVDRDEGNAHPTVKPTAVMRYLCRLVTPPGGTVLDPFMGSGSTGKAARLEGFGFIGIEREAEYLAIARARVEGAK